MSKMIFDTYLPVKVLFGEGKINEIATVTKEYGEKALLVTVPWVDKQRETFAKVKKLMEDGGMEVVVHDKVVPNPTTTIINEGVALAKREGVDVVVGVGGGSSIDAAKAIAVGATHPGTPWDYVYINSERPTDRTLPIVAVTTTSGTGSHVTKYSVFTNPELEIKSTIVDPVVFPKVSIVDPDLMIGMPAYITAITGFDAFSHAFESYTNINSNRFIDMLALEAISIIVRNLPMALENPENREIRGELAYADTLAGISIANVGTTLPHSMGQPISGRYPTVLHGESLAAVYPEFFKLTYTTCISRFAKVARLFNRDLEKAADEDAARESVNELIKFQKRIGVYTSLGKLGVKEDRMEGIIRDTMACPDTYVTTAVPDEAKVREMFNNMKRI